MDARLSLLEQWVHGCMTELGVKIDYVKLTSVSGDASFRRYFRFTHQANSWIAVDAPPEKEDSRPFVKLATQWKAQGVPVPQVFFFNEAGGFMLLEDFGDQLLLPELNTDTADRLYGIAMRELIAIQRCDNAELPPYDQPLLRRELNLFDEWFVGKLLALSLSESEQNALFDSYTCLEHAVMSQPQVTVHRDYHARNLMLLAEQQDRLGIIDFQDAVSGAYTYDLVSLLRDAYVRWPAAKVEAWVEVFRQQLLALGQIVADPEQFLREFDLMGMQRQLKVLGIFARLYLRDGKSGYLGDIPRVLGYLVRAAKNYPEYSELVSLLEYKVIPALTAHPLFDAQQIEQQLQSY